MKKGAKTELDAIDNLIKMLSDELKSNENFKKYIAKKKLLDEEGATVEMPTECTLDILDIDRIKQAANILSAALEMKKNLLLREDIKENSNTGVVILPEVKATKQ